MVMALIRILCDFLPVDRLANKIRTYHHTSEVQAALHKKEIEDMCPREYYCDYLNWLLGITGSISVWGNCAEHFIVYKTINKKQIATLKKLKKHGLYKGSIPII